MFKKMVFLALLIVLFIAGVPAFAENTTPATIDLSGLIAKLPSLSQCVLFDPADNAVQYAMSFPVMGIWKMKDGEHLITFNGTWVPATNAGVSLSLKLVDLGKIVTFPILKYVTLKPTAYYGFDDIGSGKLFEQGKFRYGVEVLSIKF